MSDSKNEVEVDNSVNNETCNLLDEMNRPRHFLFCDNGVCKIDISQCDTDDKFDKYKSFMRAYFENALSNSINNLKTKNYNVDLLQNTTDFITAFNETSFVKLKETCQEDMSKHNNMEFCNLTTDFMDTMKMFAQSQSNFSEVLIRYTDQFETVYESDSEYTSDSDDNKQDVKRVSFDVKEESDEEDSVESEEEVSEDSEETQEEVEPSGIIAVVKYFAESQRNFSNSLYNYMKRS